MKYYKIDSRKISFREYYNISHIGFVVAWFCKIVGIQLKLTRGIPEQQPFRENIIESTTVPPTILSKLNVGVMELRQVGFDQFWFYTSKNSLMSGIAYGVQALHSSRKSVGKIIYASYRNRQSFLFAFLSELASGEVLATSNDKPRFNSPRGITVFRKVGANAKETFDLHQEQLAKRESNNPPITIGNLEQVTVFEDKNTRMSYEDKITRGIWVEMTDSEVEALRAKLRPK